MKTTTSVTLDGKEVRTIIAKALDIPVSNVKPLRYNFAIEGVAPEVVEQKIKEFVKGLISDLNWSFKSMMVVVERLPLPPCDDRQARDRLTVKDHRLEQLVTN